MYVLAVEIAAYRQLNRVHRELLDRIENETRAIVETNGGDTLEQKSGTTLYRFRYAGAHELRSIVDAAWAVRGVFEKSEAELFGYTICLDQVMVRDVGAIVETLERLLHRTPQEGGLWLGPSAVTTLAPFFTLERRLDLWKAVECVENAAVLPSIDEFLEDTPVLQSVLEELDPLVNGEDTAGVLLLYGADGSGVQYLARSATRKVNGCVSAPTIVSPPSRFDPATAFASLVCHEHYSRVPEFLNGEDGAAWDRVGYSLAGAWAMKPGVAQPDHHVEDLRVALRLFVESYAMRMQETAGKAILVVEQLETLPDSFCTVIVDACRRPVESGRLLLLATSVRPFVPSPLREIDYRKSGVRNLNLEAVSRILGGMPPFIHLDTATQVRAFSRGRLLHLYHYLWLVERTGRSPALGEDVDAKRFRRLLCDAMDPAEVEALFVTGLAAGRLGPEQLTEVLVSAGHAQPAASELWSSLASFGFVRDTKLPFPSYEALFPFLEQRLGARAEELRSGIQNAVYRSFRLGSLELSPDRYVLLSEHPDPKISFEAFVHFSEQLLYRNERGLLESLLSGAIAPGTAGDSSATRGDVEALMQVLRLADICRKGSVDDAERAYQAWSTIPEHNLGQATRAKLALERARFQLSVDRVRDADGLARRSALLYQEIGEQEAAGEAQIEFGRVQLAMGRASEAREYFAIARSESDNRLPAFHVVRSRNLEAVAAFAYGNYTLAIERAEQAEHDAAAARNRDWELFAGFVRGRIDMELGRYDEAIDRFGVSRARAHANGHTKALRVLTAWHGRALAFAGDPDAAVGMLTSPDSGVSGVQSNSSVSDEQEHGDGNAAALFSGLGKWSAELTRSLSLNAEHVLFLAEALSMKGELEAAVDILGARPHGGRRALRPTLYARWQNGFDGVEATTSRETPSDIVERLCRGFHGYLLGRMGRVEEAVSELRYCTREAKPSELDPNAPLLYYWYATTLPNNRDSTYDDPATELGRSVNLVQSRAGRTDDHREKSDYR
ncbi:MAG: tetratricopeptide repeat protein, partial [Spirochaetia bacterium]